MATTPPRLRRVDAIAIGASAGGVEALLLLLPALPVQLKVAVFVVLHLPRDRRSMLVEIFQPRCRLAVQEAQDKEPVRAGTVYFAPPDYHLLLDTGPQLALSVDEPLNYSRPSIDVLFETAADVYKDRLMGIVLTGSNDDGAAGLQAIRQAGGVTVVQDPATATMGEMPAAALRRGPAHRVFSLQQIAEMLKNLDNGVECD